MRAMERTFELKAYGQFLQCIPIPGRNAEFITLQGQAKLYNMIERRTEKEMEKVLTELISSRLHQN